MRLRGYEVTGTSSAATVMIADNDNNTTGNDINFTIEGFLDR